MINKDISFSVVIPAYKSENFIFKSVSSALNQSFSPLEVIVIVDPPFDSELDILNKINDDRLIVLKNEKNMGPAYSRNRGWSIAKGNYVAFLDSDDIWFKDKLLYQSKIIERYNPVLLSCENIYSKDYIDRVNDSKEIVKRVSINKQLLKNRFHTSNVVVKKDLSIRFDESYRMSEDFMLWSRIVSENKNCFYSNIVVSYYYEDEHKQGLSSNFKKIYKYGEKKVLSILRKEKRINLFQYLFFSLWLWMKYLIRRAFNRKVFANKKQD